MAGRLAQDGEFGPPPLLCDFSDGGAPLGPEGASQTMRRECECCRAERMFTLFEERIGFNASRGRRNKA